MMSEKDGSSYTLLLNTSPDESFSREIDLRQFDTSYDGFRWRRDEPRWWQRLGRRFTLRHIQLLIPAIGIFLIITFIKVHGSDIGQAKDVFLAPLHDAVDTAANTIPVHTTTPESSHLSAFKPVEATHSSAPVDSIASPAESIKEAAKEIIKETLDDMKKEAKEQQQKEQQHTKAKESSSKGMTKEILKQPAHAHLPTYDEIQASPKSIWAYEDVYTSTHESCRAMRSKLQAIQIKSDRKPSHSRASIGKPDIFKTSTCLTYEDRFAPYTDKSLGLTYRDVRDERLPSDWLLGPQKPKNMFKDEWEFYLNLRHKEMNTKVNAEQRALIPDWKALSDRCGLEELEPRVPKHKTVILYRFFQGFVMTEDKILDLRAMLTEMVINRPYDGWDIRILVEIKESKGAFISKNLQHEILMPMMPYEFWGLVEFWSEEREKAIMPGVISPIDYGFALNCLLPSQLYSFYHPEFDFVYNWEADLRFLGNYSTFFDTASEFGRQESMNLGMERYSRWFIPGSKASERFWNRNKDETKGIGKEADLLTFNAILDIKGSDWFHSLAHADFGNDSPLRTSIVSLLRMSKPLLKAMTLATVEKEKSMQCEAWPSTVVLHSQLPPSPRLTFDEELAAEMGSNIPFKGVFVPHPVYLSQKWEADEIDYQINRRRYFRNEHFMGKSTFNWAADLPGIIYENWRQRVGEDTCRASALMHPIKDVGY